MRAIVFLFLGYQLSFSYTFWYDFRWVGENPRIWTNEDTPTNLRPGVENAIKTWKGSGAAIFPVYQGITGRDCGVGDSWGVPDDDDGYNVVDYWDHCESNGVLPNTSFMETSDCTKWGGEALAAASAIDIYNFDWARFAEVDIYVCPDNITHTGIPMPWTNQIYHSGTDLNYQGVVTHELGHLMGLNHSSESEMESNSLLWNATMYFENIGWGFPARSLNKDDIDGIRARYGVKFDWFIMNNQGHSVSIAPEANGGVSLYLNPLGKGTTWTNPVSIMNGTFVSYIDNGSRVGWDENDKDHSSIMSFMMTGADGVMRWLYYARNASNWWDNTGWVNMAGTTPGYNFWTTIDRNIYWDYYTEYRVAPVDCHMVHYEHFAYGPWTGDHGGAIRNFYLK